MGRTNKGQSENIQINEKRSYCYKACQRKSEIRAISENQSENRANTFLRKTINYFEEGKMHERREENK